MLQSTKNVLFSSTIVNQQIENSQKDLFIFTGNLSSHSVLLQYEQQHPFNLYFKCYRFVSKKKQLKGSLLKHKIILLNVSIIIALNSRLYRIELSQLECNKHAENNYFIDFFVVETSKSAQKICGAQTLNRKVIKL